MGDKHPRTIEPTWIGNKSQSMSEVVFDKLVAAPDGGYDDNAPFLDAYVH
jgi:hypothetical protein